MSTLRHPSRRLARLRPKGSTRAWPPAPACAACNPCPSGKVWGGRMGRCHGAARCLTSTSAPMPARRGRWRQACWAAASRQMTHCTRRGEGRGAHACMHGARIQGVHSSRVCRQAPPASRPAHLHMSTLCVRPSSKQLLGKGQGSLPLIRGKGCPPATAGPEGPCL